MDKDMYNLFVTIGKCHQLLKQHARELALRPGVKDVIHWFDILDVDGAFRLEEFVDAGLTNGEAISWCWEVTLTDSSIMMKRMCAKSMMSLRMFLWRSQTVNTRTR